MPPSLSVIAAQVQDRLRDFLAPEEARWSAFDDDLAEPVREIGRLVLVGGKRLRPAFCHWGFVGAGGDPTDSRVVDAGAAFELMHAFALFHDDVMDDAASRRGNATTHTVFTQHHREHGWAGESRRFGEGVAILVGDLAFVYADQLMVDAGPAAWRIWNELRIELNVGQVLDIVGSVRRRWKAWCSEGLSSSPRNFNGALKIPERYLKMGMVVGSGLTMCGALWIMRLRSCTASRTSRNSPFSR